MKLFILCFFFLSFLNASCEDGFDMATDHFKIDKKILKEIATTESNQNPYAILIKTKNNKDILDLLIKFNIPHKASEPYISINPRNKSEALMAYHGILKNEQLDILDYDLGMMQVNKQNFISYKVNEEDFYLTCHKNIFLGSDVLRKCYDKFKTPKETIECYNRGPSAERIKQSGYIYFNRFYGNYSIASLSTKK